MAYQFLISNFYLCDTEADLPPILHLGDAAIIKDNLKIIYIANPISGEWQKINIQEDPIPGPPGPQGEPGDITKAWPLNDGVSAVFFVDKEETDPATVLGFGTWEKVGKIPGLDIWGWRRTA